MYAVRAFLDEHPNSRLVTKAGASSQGVGQVEVRRVLVARQHRGDPSLSPACRCLRQVAFGQHPDSHARLACEPHRGREAGYTAAYDKHVEAVTHRVLIFRPWWAGHRACTKAAGASLPYCR